MIDSADRRRMEETGVELQQLLDEVNKCAVYPSYSLIVVISLYLYLSVYFYTSILLCACLSLSFYLSLSLSLIPSLSLCFTPSLYVFMLLSFSQSLFHPCVSSSHLICVCIYFNLISSTYKLKIIAISPSFCLPLNLTHSSLFLLSLFSRNV